MIDRMFVKALGAVFIFIMICVFAGVVMLCTKSAYSMERCEPYREMVEVILKQEAVSVDYYYLMVAESKCTQKALSGKGARGFWQLMPSTSKHYGCNDPFDLECSTRAAAKYLKHLESVFSSFDDVIIAYNMGGHNYKRIGKPTSEAKGLLMTVKGYLRNDNQ